MNEEARLDAFEWFPPNAFMNLAGSSPEMNLMPDSVVHFEIPVDNMGRAQKFYKETFGWSINAMPEMGYALLGTAPSNEDGRPTQPGAINGGMLEDTKTQSNIQ